MHGKRPVGGGSCVVYATQDDTGRAGPTVYPFVTAGVCGPVRLTDEVKRKVCGLSAAPQHRGTPNVIRCRLR